ncbi:hypothetical protein [Thalassobellus suaedae]|uniref:Uncharacterized protein n=1 Tax=Thalassobellus suaedae TaxID=3074124 RepID=A0ABY9XTF0_9FLAO|nr:hypothetical protein RHP51_19570 [Flavobacteriaceae bacterium HL-DH14]
MLKRITQLFFYCFCSILIAQQDLLSFKNGIDNPTLLTTHHFGIFSARINTNFKFAPPKTITFSLSSVSGNNFQPYVEAYLPQEPAVRQEQSKLSWYKRDFKFLNQETTPVDYMNIIIDAVIKEFRLTTIIPLSKKHELDISIRSYLITKGKQPFSFFTGDETIEWFHSNINGGEDPFGRRYYGLNQVNFNYTDRNNNTLELTNNDFFIGGIEFNHFYYPRFSINKTKHIFMNFGSHLGINTSKFNPSIDIGISANAIKMFQLKDKQELNLGIGINLLRKNVINFDTVIDLGNNAYLATAESNIEYTRYTKKNNYHALGINYQIQSRYNKLKEADYYRLVGDWSAINGGWHLGFDSLYRNLSIWTLIYTYGHPNYKVSVYFKEDFIVHNAPDFQTGISLQVPILK